MIQNVNKQEYNYGSHEKIKLMEWTDMWQIKFNVEKCKVIHFGRKNEERQSRMKHCSGTEVCSLIIKSDMAG